MYSVGRSSYDKDEEPDLSLGRVGPHMAQNLKQRLVKQKIKSEFIQVIGENVRFTSLRITIPFKESDGNDLKVLRYDPTMREFTEEEFWVDKVDKTVTVSGFYPGIFVVVEE